MAGCPDVGADEAPACCFAVRGLFLDFYLTAADLVRDIVFTSLEGEVSAYDFRWACRHNPFVPGEDEYWEDEFRRCGQYDDDECADLRRSARGRGAERPRVRTWDAGWRLVRPAPPVSGSRNLCGEKEAGGKQRNNFGRPAGCGQERG